MTVAGTLNPSALAPLVDDYRRELDEIESVFHKVSDTPTVRGYSFATAPAEDGCVVALWDAWSRFMRSLLLTCSAGTVQSLSKRCYAPVISRRELDALRHIKASSANTKIKVVRGEPQWSLIPGILDLVRVLELSNQARISGAVTASTVQLGIVTSANPLEQIRLCRNFIAHKCDGTLRELRYSGAPPSGDLRQYLRAKQHGVELFSVWKEGCLAIARAASS